MDFIAPGMAPVSDSVMMEMLSSLDNQPAMNKRARTDYAQPAAGDKLKQQRELNRQHARNTRARKKQHLEDLQSRVEKLEAEKSAKHAEITKQAEMLEEKHAKWRQTVRTLLNYRTSGQMDEELWRAILTEDFKFTLPITPYRSYNPTDLVNSRRVTLGVEGMVSDTASMMVMAESIAPKTAGKESKVSMEYLLGRSEHMFMGPTGLMSTFLLHTTDAVSKGAACEMEQSGMIRAQFAEDGRLEELDMMFDAIAWYHQLQKAARVESYPIVPNTLEEACKLEKGNVVITTAQRPFRITHVNNAWTNLCGFTLDECKGKTLSILQGPETDMATVETLCNQSENAYPSSMVVTNHSKDGRTFRNHLRCYPLTENDKDGEITHILGKSLCPIPSLEVVFSLPLLQTLLRSPERGPVRKRDYKRHETGERPNACSCCKCIKCHRALLPRSLMTDTLHTPLLASQAVQPPRAQSFLFCWGGVKGALELSRAIIMDLPCAGCTSARSSLFILLFPVGDGGESSVR
ncbi:unnamed protein product [Chrysoparadoxa australica]